jgi:hypothetical protein
MHVRVAVTIAVAGTLLASHAGHAQSRQPWALQASLLAAGQSLNDGIVSGFGFEGQLRYTKSHWSFGLGFQTTKHTADDEHITISGVFFEPRRIIDVGSLRFAPYIAGRIAVLRESAMLHDPENPTTELFETSSGGSAFGAGAGFIIVATSKMNIDVGAAFVSQSFAEVRGEGRVWTFSRFTGYVAKGGLSFGFGGTD